MFSTVQPFSSQRKEKDHMERLTPLQEKELENADLRRQVRDLQQEVDELRTRNEDLGAEQKAKNEVIERLSNELHFHKKEISSYKKHDVEREDLFHKHCEEIRAADERHRLELADARKMTDKVSSPIPLSASKKAETKERANPFQLEQSGSHSHAGELESQKTSNDATDEDFETVKDKKNKAALGSGSKATISIRSLSKTNCLQASDEDKVGKNKKEPKKAEVPNQNSADKRYVVPPPDKVKSAEQSRASSTWPWSVPSSTPETSVSITPNTSILGSGDRHGFKRSWASPLKAESVNDLAQKAATSAQPNSGETPDFFEILMAKHQERYGVNVDVEKELAKIKQRHAAESSEPGQDQMRGVDSSSKSKSRQLKATTHGDKVMQSADEDMLNEGGPRLATEVEEDEGVEATRESKQPGVESTKAKRSFSQSFSEPELSQKKTKTDEN